MQNPARLRTWASAAAMTALIVGAAAATEPPVFFVRGDVNQDGTVNVADAVAVLGVIFSGQESSCRDANDVNDDGRVNVADPIRLLGSLFGGLGNPPPPFETCGPDMTEDSLDCNLFAGCAAPRLDSTGILHHQGTPMHEITNTAPAFWFRDEAAGQTLEGAYAHYDPATSRYHFYNLAPETGIAITFHITEGPISHPGNYRLWMVWRNDMAVEQDLQIPLVMQLLTPEDSSASIPWPPPYPSYTAPLTFSWQAVPGADQYRVRIGLARDPGHPDGAGTIDSFLVWESTSETTYVTAVPKSAAGEHYAFAVQAYQAGEVIAYLMITHGGGMGWEYRFKLE